MTSTIMKISDPGDLFGGISGQTALRGTELSVQQQREAAIAQAAEVERARDDINRLFPQAQARGQQGFQGALDVFRGALPQQAQQFQQGNVAAQQSILAGLPQIQNAILGGNVDLSQLQAFQAQTPTFDFLPQNINPVGFQQQQEQAAEQVAAEQAAAAQAAAAQATAQQPPTNALGGGQNRFRQPR